MHVHGVNITLIGTFSTNVPGLILRNFMGSTIFKRVVPNLDPDPSQLRGLGERCKLPSGVWGGAPVASDFGEFYTEKEAFGAI